MNLFNGTRMTLRLQLLFWLMAGLWPGSGMTQPDPLTSRLISGLEGENVRMAREAAGFVAAHPQELPWLKNLEFRTETGGFRLEEQEVLLRLSPNAPTAIDRQKRLSGVLIQEYDTRIRAEIHRTVGEIYDCAIRQRVQQEKQGLFDQALEILDQQIAWTSREDPDLRPDLDRWIGIEKDRQQWLQRRIRETGTTEGTCLTTYGTDSLTLARLPSDYPWITPAGMWKVMSDTVNWTSPDLDRERLRREEVVWANAVDKARRRQIVDFVQARYQQDPKDPFREEFSISLGLNIPYAGRDHLDRQKQELKLLEANQDVRREAMALSMDLGSIQNAFRDLEERRNRLEAEWDRSFLSRVANGDFPGIGDDPLLILEARIAGIRHRLAVLDLLEEETERYLDWADRSGYQSAAPLRNILHRDQLRL